MDWDFRLGFDTRVGLVRFQEENDAILDSSSFLLTVQGEFTIISINWVRNKGFKYQSIRDVSADTYRFFKGSIPILTDIRSDTGRYRPIFDRIPDTAI